MPAATISYVYQQKSTCEDFKVVKAVRLPTIAGNPRMLKLRVNSRLEGETNSSTLGPCESPRSATSWSGGTTSYATSATPGRSLGLCDPGGGWGGGLAFRGLRITARQNLSRRRLQTNGTNNTNWIPYLLNMSTIVRAPASSSLRVWRTQTTSSLRLKPLGAWRDGCYRAQAEGCHCSL